MRIQDQVKFCGTISINGVMTDVYDHCTGTRLFNGHTSRKDMSEESLIEVLNDPGVVIYDWRE